jgi:hypothetical protein
MATVVLSHTDSTWDFQCQSCQSVTTVTGAEVISKGAVCCVSCARWIDARELAHELRLAGKPTGGFILGN